MHFWEWSELGNNPEGGGVLRVRYPDHSWVAVLMPTTGSPRKLVELITGPNLELLPPEKIVGAIIRGAEDAMVVPTDGSYSVDYYYECVYGPPNRLVAWAKKRGDSSPVFTGDLISFVKFAAGKILPDTVVGKVVRFYYKGGTHEGWRTVKIESLTDTHVKGVDCEKMEPRCYRIDVIGSDLVVLA
jgi:hypothetical protein